MSDKNWIQIVSEYLGKVADFSQLEGEKRNRFLMDMYTGLLSRVFADLEDKLSLEERVSLAEKVTQARDSQEEMLVVVDNLIKTVLSREGYDVRVRVREMVERLNDELVSGFGDGEKKELENIVKDLLEGDHA